MKYSTTNPPLQCMMSQSTCYNGSTKGTPVGILWHCTGANNPWLKRYVQPDDNAKDKDVLLRLLGKNSYKNDWNHAYIQAGLNFFIGKLADGSVTTVQTLPDTLRPWGCGSGKYGSCNGKTGGPFWEQFEICEDSLTNENYFGDCYIEACELTAYLCKKFNIDPKGTVNYNGVKVPTILCHYDSCKLGLGSNHYDVYNWFNKFAKVMDNVRNDVKALMEGQLVVYGDDNMTQETWNKFMDAWLKKQATLPPSDWSKADREWAEKNGIVKGDSDGNKRYKSLITREENVAMLHREYELKKQDR